MVSMKTRRDSVLKSLKTLILAILGLGGVAACGDRSNTRHRFGKNSDTSQPARNGGGGTIGTPGLTMKSASAFGTYTCPNLQLSSTVKSCQAQVTSLYVPGSNPVCAALIASPTISIQPLTIASFRCNPSQIAANPGVVLSSCSASCVLISSGIATGGCNIAGRATFRGVTPPTTSATVTVAPTVKCLMSWAAYL